MPLVIALQVSRRVWRPIGGVTEATGQLGEFVLVRRQRMGLKMVEDLEAMLDGPKEGVGRRQFRVLIGRDMPPVSQALERAQRVGPADPRVACPVQELEGLDDKLDLADASIAQLDVAIGLLIPPDLRIDPIFHGPDLRDGAVVE